MGTLLGGRKFILAAFATLVATIGLFTGTLEGSEWITAQTIVLGLYSTANVTQKRKHDA